MTRLHVRFSHFHFQVLMRIVEQIANLSTQSPLLASSASKSDALRTSNHPSRTSNGSSIAVNGSDTVTAHLANIKSTDKINRFEELIQNVCDKHGISSSHRLRNELHPNNTFSSNNIYNNNNNHNNRDNNKNSTDNSYNHNNMGSNVSRHSGKGLSGRRTLSSGE